MGFSFVHTADWQIGSPFGRVPDDTAALLKAARVDGIDRIAVTATAAKARHVLVAGDVFDHCRPPQKTVGQLLARLDAHPDLVWHLLPGNHDPAQAGGVWDEVVKIKPANVHAHVSASPVEIEAGVWLLPAPLHARAMSSDPTAFMDQVETPRGAIRIGMAHGSVRGFNSEGEAAIPIDIERASKARLDYLALGDWHGLQKIDSRTWYSGTHEPDGYKDNAPGNALVVSVNAAGAAPDVRAVPTGHYRWKRQELLVHGLTDLDRFASGLAADPLPRARMMLRLDLTGHIPLADYGAITERIEALAYGLAHLDADRSALTTTTSEDDLDALGNGSIGTIARRLAEVSRSGETPDQIVATRALQTLTRLAGQTA